MTVLVPGVWSRWPLNARRGDFRGSNRGPVDGMQCYIVLVSVSAVELACVTRFTDVIRCRGEGDCLNFFSPKPSTRLSHCDEQTTLAISVREIVPTKASMPAKSCRLPYSTRKRVTGGARVLVVRVTPKLRPATFQGRLADEGAMIVFSNICFCYVQFSPCSFDVSILVPRPCSEAGRLTECLPESVCCDLHVPGRDHDHNLTSSFSMLSA